MKRPDTAESLPRDAPADGLARVRPCWVCSVSAMSSSTRSSPAHGQRQVRTIAGRALYWTRRTWRSIPNARLVLHTARDWLESTGLSRREQETRAPRAGRRNLVLQQRAGMPARLHFKVNLDETGRGLAVHLGEPESAWQWDDARLRRLLGRPVAFFRPLATVSGSVAAGLYLSHLCMAMRAMAMRGERCAAASQEGWMDLPIQASAQRLCLGAKSLRNARSRLVSGGLVEGTLGAGHAATQAHPHRPPTTRASAEPPQKRPSRCEHKATSPWRCGIGGIGQSQDDHCAKP